MPLSPNMRGALFMAVSMAAFTLSDAVSKYVSVEMSSGQIMFFRGVVATALIALLAWRQGALDDWRRVLHPTVLLRAFGEGTATITYIYALSLLPIGNVSAVQQALPLAVTMGAALVFAEPVGWRRWSAIAAGFIGVMVIVRPGFEGFSVYTLLVLVSVVMCAVRDLATRRIPENVPTTLVSTATSIIVTVLGFGLMGAAGEARAAPPLWCVEMLAGAAVLLVIGYQFIIAATRDGDISFVAPFRYTALLWSIVLGYIVWGDAPDTPMIVGSLIIVGSGLYALYRERAAGKPLVAARSTTPALAPDGL